MSGVVVGVVVASLLGSLHCAGMCGPLVAACSLPAERPALATALFTGSRLVMYVAWGAAAGAAGSALDLAGRSAGLSHVAALVAGCALVAWGGATLLGATGIARPRLSRLPLVRRVSPALARIVARLQHASRGRSEAQRAVALGVAAALLPCGWLHAFTIAAAGTGSAATGALMLAAFWLGTVPATVGVGLAVGKLSPTARRRLPVVSATLVVVLGIVALLGRGGPFAVAALSDEAADAPSCHAAETKNVDATDGARGLARGLD